LRDGRAIVVQSCGQCGWGGGQSTDNGFLHISLEVKLYLVKARVNPNADSRRLGARARSELTRRLNSLMYMRKANSPLPLTELQGTFTLEPDNPQRFHSLFTGRSLSIHSTRVACSQLGCVGWVRVGVHAKFARLYKYIYIYIYIWVRVHVHAKFAYLCLI